MTYNIDKLSGDRWKIYREDLVSGTLYYTQKIILSTDEILELAKKVVPKYREEIFVKGDPNCNHRWKPYKLNNHFKLCNDCDAILKIHKKVPKI